MTQSAFNSDSETRRMIMRHSSENASTNFIVTGAWHASADRDERSKRRNCCTNKAARSRLYSNQANGPRKPGDRRNHESALLL